MKDSLLKDLEADGRFDLDEEVKIYLYQVEFISKKLPKFNPKKESITNWMIKYEHYSNLFKLDDKKRSVNLYHFLDHGYRFISFLSNHDI